MLVFLLICSFEKNYKFLTVDFDVKIGRVKVDIINKKDFAEVLCR